MYSQAAKVVFIESESGRRSKSVVFGAEQLIFSYIICQDVKSDGQDESQLGWGRRWEHRATALSQVGTCPPFFFHFTSIPGLLSLLSSVVIISQTDWFYRIVLKSVTRCWKQNGRMREGMRPSCRTQVKTGDISRKLTATWSQIELHRGAVIKFIWLYISTQTDTVLFTLRLWGGW